MPRYFSNVSKAADVAPGELPGAIGVLATQDPPMSETPPPPKPHPATVSWGKAQQYLDKLWESLEALDEAGGMVAAAEAGGWSPKARKKAESSLVAAKEAVERALKQLRGVRPGG